MSKELRQMRQAGKTFYFASFWLNSQIRAEVSVAYYFCRWVDDIADEIPELPNRNEKLLQIISSIESRASLRLTNLSSMDTNSDELTGIISLIYKYPEIQKPVTDLVFACLNDNQELKIANSSDLAKHAFGVAGNVGLIMFPILGGKNPVGRSFAAELGIAMQYTNIARDILTDFEHQRVYLPTDWLGSLDPTTLATNELSDNQQVLSCASKLLELADNKYRFGLSGLSYLSPDCQYSIRVAAECYQAIGQGVIKNNKLVRRSVVPLYKKVFLVMRQMFKRASKPELTVALERVDEKR